MLSFTASRAVAIFFEQREEQGWRRSGCGGYTDGRKGVGADAWIGTGFVHQGSGGDKISNTLKEYLPPYDPNEVLAV